MHGETVKLGTTAYEVTTWKPLVKIVHYIKNQQDATLAVLFISNCKITLHISDAICVHHQEYQKL